MKKLSWYDEQEDIFGININAKKKYWKSIELKNGVIIDISKNGQIIGFEIPNAKKIFSGKAEKILQTTKNL